MNRHTIRGKRGFTLLEMLMAMGLLSVIMYALLSMFSQTQRAMEKGVAQIETTQDARLVLDMMETDINGIAFAEAANEYRLYPGKVQKTKKYADEVFVPGSTSKSFTVYCTRPGAVTTFCEAKYYLENENGKLKYFYRIYDTTTDTWIDCTKDGSAIELLDNVASFRVSVPQEYQSHQTRSGTRVTAPTVITLELAVVDEETRKLGYRSLQDAKERKLNVSTIEERLGVTAYNARLKRFKRTIFVDCSVIADGE